MGVGVAEDVGVTEGVGVGVAEGVGVTEGVGVAEDVGVTEGVGVAEDVGIAVGASITPAAGGSSSVFPFPAAVSDLRSHPMKKRQRAVRRSRAAVPFSAVLFHRFGGIMPVFLLCGVAQ